MYATAKHKLPADSSGSSVALWPAVLGTESSFPAALTLCSWKHRRGIPSTTAPCLW